MHALEYMFPYMAVRQQLGITERQVVVLGAAQAYVEEMSFCDYQAALDALRLVDPDETGLWIRELGPALEQLRRTKYAHDFPTDLGTYLLVERDGEDFYLRGYLGGDRWLAFALDEEGHVDLTNEYHLDGSALICEEHYALGDLIETLESPPLVYIGPEVSDWKREGF